MLVFFIHGVNTQNYRYADALIKNIKENVKNQQAFTRAFGEIYLMTRNTKLLGISRKIFQELVRSMMNTRGTTVIFIDIKTEEMS